MRTTAFERRLIAWSGTAMLLILVLVPFHATLTVWLSQFVGHYTALRLWKECLMLLLAGVAIYVLVWRPDVRNHVLGSRLTWAIGAFVVLHVVWGVVALALHQVMPLALGYAWIADTRFVVFFLVVWTLALAGADIYARWPRAVFWPAALVVAFGLVQYFVLPYTFMEHLGYTAATIFPYEDINHNIHYIRVMSSLRGANPLGAYLVVVLGLFAAWCVGRRNAWRSVIPARRAVWILFGLASVGVLILSFSRGAWLGAAASFVCIVVPMLWRAKTRTMLLLGGIAVVLAGIGVAVVLQHNTTFQNVFLHTDSDSAITTTSNAAHASALQTGISQVLHEPLGRGPGTAGPASVYNEGHEARIAEDYYIQVAQEMGWLGIVLFLIVNALVGLELWRRRQDTLAWGLLAAFVGLAVVNLFSHAWADDTLAYLWWGLTAIACARPTIDRRNPSN